MAKELPYWKFEPNQWENGNIQMFSRDMKGLFIDLCSMYWSRLGDLPLKLAVQKLCSGDSVMIDSLISEGIIELTDGSIMIQFLDEQLSEFEKVKDKRKTAGIKGGEARAKTASEARIKGKQFYVINCFDDQESFIKIGITADSISRRFSGKIPYEYEVLFQFSLDENLELESDCHKALNAFFYEPMNRFSGYLESYSLDCIDTLNEFLSFRTSFAIAKGLIRNPIKIRREEKREEETIKDILLEKEPKELNKRFDFKSALLSIGVSEKHATDWMDVRRKQKAANTETAFDEVYKQINKSGFTPDEAVRIAAANSWRGLKADWLKNTMNNGTTKNTGTNSASDRLDDAKRNMAEQLTAAFGKQAGGEQGIPNNDFPGNGASDANTG